MQKSSQPITCEQLNAFNDVDMVRMICWSSNCSNFRNCKP